jgi:hypothetical protein
VKDPRSLWLTSCIAGKVLLETRLQGLSTVRWPLPCPRSDSRATGPGSGRPLARSAARLAPERCERAVEGEARPTTLEGAEEAADDEARPPAADPRRTWGGLPLPLLSACSHRWFRLLREERSSEGIGETRGSSGSTEVAASSPTAGSGSDAGGGSCARAGGEEEAARGRTRPGGGGGTGRRGKYADCSFG